MNIFNRYTLNSLKKNKVRTIVTIIGIILSVAMFTAVTEAFYSAQYFMLEYTELTEGKYHLSVDHIKDLDAFDEKKDDGVKDIAYLRGIGYAEIGTENDYKPYLHIAAVEKDYTDMMPITLTEGRLPQNSSEIVVSEHIDYNGGVELELGQTLTLDVGRRQWTDLNSAGATEYKELAGDTWQELTQNVAYQLEEETLTDTVKKTYTVVGFCSRPSRSTVEPYQSPGYTAYTIYDGGEYSDISAFITLKNPQQYEKYVEKYNANEISSYSIGVNRDLLTYSLYYRDEFTAMFFGLAAILVVLIVLGSVSLIYNTFSISVSERTKQFGILKSIGATKKQMRNSVLFEALVLCVFGVPLGLFFGCLGIGVTFKALGPSFGAVLSDLSDTTSLRFVFSLSAVIAAAVLGIMTVVISAYIPARKAVKVSPIESIRQSKEVKFGRRSVKISPLTRKLFGFEGMISAKYFKRSRRKYRVTVMSLFMSVVLFISASSLTAYFGKSIDEDLTDVNYDLYYSIEGTVDVETRNVFENAVKEMGFDEIHTHKLTNGYGYMDINQMSDELFEALGVVDKNSSAILTSVDFILNVVPDEYFGEILDDNGIPHEGYFDKNNPTGLLFDHYRKTVINENGKIIEEISYHHFDRDIFPGEIYIDRNVWELSYIEGYEEFDDYQFLGWESGEIGTFLSFAKYDEKTGEEIERINVPWEEAVVREKYNIGHVIDTVPDYVYGDTGFSKVLIYPESAYPDYVNSYFETGAYINTDNYNEAEKQIRELFKDFDIQENASLYNAAADFASTRAVMLIRLMLTASSH